MSFQKLLCPIDFSAESDYAMRVAAQLAIRSQAELVLVHAWYSGEHALHSQKNPVPDIEQVIDNEEAALAAAARDASNLGVARVSSNLVLGYAAEEVLAVLRDTPFDLVVMGTRGRTGLTRVLGSVTDALVRQSPCPVLVTRARPDAPRFRNLMVAVDFSESARQSIDLAASLIEPDGRITLLHVEEPAEPQHRSRLLAEWAIALELRARVPVNAVTKVGSATTGILAVLDERPYDLVVMGSRGLTGARALLGSVAEAVVRRARCSVLVARAR